MGRDEQRPGAAAEVLLEPLDRPDVEVVRRLVEQEQVRVGDDEPGEGRARLLAAGDRRRRPRPLVAREAEAGQRLVDPLVERVAAEDVEPVLEVGVVGARRRGRRARGAPSSSAIRSRWAAPWRTAERRSGAAMNASSKCASWPSSPSVSPRLRADRPAVGLVAPRRDAEQRRLAGAVRPDEADPLARARWPRVIRSRMTNVPISRTTPSSRTRLTPPLPAPRRAASRRAAAAAAVRAVAVARPLGLGGPSGPSAPSPSSSTQRRPGRRAGGAARARRHRRAGASRRRAVAARGQPLAPRAEVGGPDADDDPPDRAPAAAARLAGALVDVEPLLHLAVAVGRRVVVDRGAAALDGLGEDRDDVAVQRAARRPGGGCARSAAGGASTATAPRRRRCCRRRR